MGGWVPFDADSWPIVAEYLAKPWPREAILFDLRWWADQERMGRQARPGRTALRDRWGVTDWQAKKALLAEQEWGDPSRSTSDPPAIHQPDASGDTGERRLLRGNRQPAASDPPANRPTRVGDHPTPTPMDPLPKPPAGGGGLSPAAEWVVEVALDTLRGLDREAGPTAERWQRADQAEVALLIDRIRGDRRRGPDGRPRRSPIPGAPEGLRRRDVAAGVAEAARRWLARQRDAPDGASTSSTTARSPPPPP